MSPSREQLAPPDLAGYSYRRLLGSGGFADVFLYEREFPRQDVAIKVLDRVDDGSGGRERFMSEANAMASVSSHPFIVTIFHADVSPNGHPFLVMEYYPGANYSERSRTERASVAEVLRLGIQVASAVETAHRAGFLHRDIKPANILTSAYGRPGLTDFGIAADRESAAEAEGLSIPWSPPEMLTGDGSSDERSDLYSLAATLYTVIEGRSPFERSGDRNRSIDLIDRIEREPLPRFGRPDAPDSLYRLLAQAMAKERGGRPTSAAEFARSLQAIEVEQRFDVTPLELSGVIVERSESVPIDVDAGHTRVKNPTVVTGQSRFQAAGETVLRNPSGRRDQVAPTAAIRNVPFAVPDADIQRPAPRGGAQHSTTAPNSASYHPNPKAPAMNIPGSDRETVDRATWWQDRKSRTFRTVVIAIAVIVLALAAVLVTKSLSGSGSGRHKAVGAQKDLAPRAMLTGAELRLFSPVAMMEAAPL